MCTGHSVWSPRAGVRARIYKASVHIVITILCWNWVGRVSHFYFNGIGDFKRGCAKRRVITCIPPRKKISGGPASRFTILVFHSMRFYLKPPPRLNVKLTRARRRLNFLLVFPSNRQFAILYPRGVHRCRMAVVICLWFLSNECLVEVPDGRSDKSITNVRIRTVLLIIKFSHPRGTSVHV